MLVERCTEILPRGSPGQLPRFRLTQRCDSPAAIAAASLAAASANKTAFAAARAAATSFAAVEPNAESFIPTMQTNTDDALLIFAD